MNATIKDIAKQAQVSFATVSRALNDKYGVRPETRERVRQIAKQLNYSPNGIARGLVKRHTHTIGLILPDITNPFFPEVARGIEEGAQEEGYSVFLCNTNWERGREDQYIELLTEKRVDGLILAPISNVVDSARERLFGSLSVVYVSNAPQNTERSFVVIDNIRGGFLATKHLIEAGYERIGFIGAKEGSLTIDERLEGYRLAHERCGRPIEERYIRLGRFTKDAGAAGIRAMIQEGDYPQAVFAENDVLAVGVMEGARALGLSVPDDLAVVGFDDIPLAAYLEVQLTTVCQPKYEMGRMAARILLEEIAAARQRNGSPGAASAGGRRVILEPELVVRRSSLRAP